MLLKLWKSIRGNAAAQGSAQTSSRRSKPKNQPAETRKLAKPTSPTRGILGMGGPHAALCRQIKKIEARSVLEIGIDDGCRAEAVLRTLQKSHPESEIQYTAIDQFEMAGSSVTLKQFHRQIRALGVTPNLIPMPIEQGLARVAHTIGGVDLVLLDQADLPAARPMLSRIAESGVILLNDGQSWKRWQTESAKAA